VTGALAALASRLKTAARVTVLTGAGVSAASGVPTFRGPDGLWRRHRPENLATPVAFARDPALVWEWYAWRRKTIARCVPNAAHEVLAAWSRTLPSCTVITQNVDDLHVRVGTARLVRLHGSIWELTCAARCQAGVRAWPDTRVSLPECPPCCPHCGGLARPAIVWFGEALDSGDISAASAATACDVFIAVGTSAVVYPAAGLLGQAAARGAWTAEINAEATPVSTEVSVSIQGAAETLLPALDALVRR
jgi:NAD-dependent deacetylase